MPDAAAPGSTAPGPAAAGFTASDSVPVDWPRALLMVGCGNMGGAMLAGWLRAGMDPGRVTVIAPRLAQTPPGVRLERDPAALAGQAFDAVLLGIKPQQLAAVAPTLAPLTGPGCVVLSMLVGIGLDRLRAAFPRADAVVRLMPNLAVAIGRSPIGLVATGLGAEPRARVTALMAPLGTAEWFTDETLFHAFGALAGSGPAFVYRFIAALASGAEALGFAPDRAERLAVSMVEGAAALAAGAADAPGTLAHKVASPGGSTRAGLDVLDADDALARLVAATLAASTARSAEIAATV